MLPLHTCAWWLRHGPAPAACTRCAPCRPAEEASEHLSALSAAEATQESRRAELTEYLGRLRSQAGVDTSEGGLHFGAAFDALVGQLLVDRRQEYQSLRGDLSLQLASQHQWVGALSDVLLSSASKLSLADERCLDRAC